MKRLGIALGGGGVRGLAHIGVLKALEDGGIPISCITGSSVGAVVGAAYAQMPNAEALLERFRKTINEFKFYKDVEEACKSECEDIQENFWGQVSRRVKQRIVINLARSRNELFSVEPMIEVINALVEAGNIEDTGILIGIVAMDLHTGEPVIMTNGDIRKAVIASASVTGYIRPVAMERYLLTDGGAIAPIPIEFLSALGAEITVGVNITCTKCFPMTDSNVVNVVMQADLHRAKKMSELMINLADIKIQPNVGDVHWSQFSRFEECLEAGIKAGETAIPKIKEVLERPEKKKWWEKWLEYLAEGGGHV
jgi:NTE family protein